ncbi:fimbrial protein [Cronobacter dublinensis]|uniref:fimbrial protein n=1 Tax=Cronobacter dublinensis TaxID=413497 RepID=UPI002895925C|nr:fimbrial protein [Cronobacter dublinensis]MDT3666903.1 fimbrial protein [Cronobacter dublinensis]
MNKAIRFSVVLFSAAASPAVLADSNTATITVRVTVNSVPCKVNNNQAIDVDFGNNVITSDVAKGAYEKSVNYALDCSNADAAKTLKMRIAGTGATFDSKVLKTNISTLGIKIKADGADFPLNTNLALASKSSKPALTALLVQQSGAKLPTGSFSAGATMTVDYQ